MSLFPKLSHGLLAVERRTYLALRALADRYSCFGISFAKNYLANCLVSPVGYVLNPFIFQAYSELMHTLDGIRSIVDGKVIPEGPKKGEVCDPRQLKACVQSLAILFESYGRDEYEFNECQARPHSHQDSFFDRPDAPYYDMREWRMVERSGSEFPWDEYREGRHYFRFEPEFVRNYHHAAHVPRRDSTMTCPAA